MIISKPTFLDNLISTFGFEIIEDGLQGFPFFECLRFYIQILSYFLQISHAPILRIKLFFKRNILKDNSLNLIAHLHHLCIFLIVNVFYLAADGHQHVIINTVEIADILGEEMALIRFIRVGNLFYVLFLIACIIRKFFYRLLDLEMISEFNAMAGLGVFIVSCCCCFVVF